VLQGLAGILRDLVLMAAAPDRPELTGVSPQFRNQLPDLAGAIGRSRLLQWQAQLRGSEQQLRQSVQPRLWLEVLLLGLLAEPIQATTAPTPQPARIASPTPAPAPAQSPPTPSTPTAISPTATSPAAVSPTAPVPAPAAAPELPPVAPAAATTGTNLPELWQQILGSLELPSTRMLLSQQAQLVRLDANRAVVQVAGNWMGMVQSRATLLEQAVAKALGGSRQLVLEAGGGPITAPAAAPPAPQVKPPSATIAQSAPAPVVQPPTASAITQPTAAASAATPPAATPKPATPEPIPSAIKAASQPAPQLPTTQTPSTQQSPDQDDKTRIQPTASNLDRQAKNLADFFNGQVLEVDQNEIPADE